MTTYLQNAGRTYRFRRVVPVELRPFLRTSTGAPRVEFSESLGTRDRREAERRCRVRAVETDQLLELARKQLHEASEAKARSSSALSRPAIEALEGDFNGDAEEDHRWEARAKVRAKLVEIARTGSGDEARALRDLLEDHLFDPPADQRRRQAELAKSWSEGEAEFLKGWASQKSITLPLAYPALMSLFTDYAAAAQIEPATHKRWKPVIQSLIDFVGHDDASCIQTADVRAWKDHLLNETIDGKALRGPKTVRETYLAALKTVLNEAVQTGRLVDNVAKTVQVRVPRSKRLRDPAFSTAEVSLILSATLREPPQHLTTGNRLARRWVPWLCAYTGARVNEITQLRAEDVIEIDGVWALNITPDAGGVKNKQARLVPLHSHLIEQGFLNVAMTKATGPLFYDPKAGRGGKSGNPHYKKVGERLAQWVRDIGVDDPLVQPNHAWRHHFTSMAREAGLDPEAREAIPGHAPATTGRAYGARPITFLKREIEKLPRFGMQGVEAPEAEPDLSSLHTSAQE